VRRGSHVVRLAVRDGNAIVGLEDLAAQLTENEAHGLASLRVRVRDFLKNEGVTTVALWFYEGSPGGVSLKTARPIVRAEGVVVAAAGELGIDVVEISAASERKRGGYKKNDDLVSALNSGLSGTWEEDARRAVAASTFA
jgi:hypothetical protein